MEKIKNFFSKLGKKFKENGKKLVFWFVLLVVSITGFFYSFRAKNDDNLVSGSADEITSVTFTSRPLDIDPVVSFSADSSTVDGVNSTYSFSFLLGLTNTYSYLSFAKNYNTNTLDFTYNLYGAMQGFYGSGTATTNKSAVLLKNFSVSLRDNPLHDPDYIYNFGRLSTGNVLTTMVSHTWLVGSSLMSYQKNGSVLNDWSVTNTRFWSVYDIVREQISAISYNGTYVDSLGVGYSYSTIDFDPATIYKVEKEYKQEPDFRLFSNAVEVSNLQFTRLTYTYFDENNNTFSFLITVMGNRYTAPNGDTVIKDTRYIGNYTTNYQDGYNDGYARGEQDKQQAVDNAYNQGKTEGYNLGRETPTYSFISLLDAVGYSVTKPFASLLNFDLLGTNLLSLATGFISLVVIVKIISLLI